MSNIHLTRGHNLKISGVPKLEIVDIPCPKEIKLIPDNFPGVKPKLLVKVGDDVKIGSKVYFDKKNTSVFFTSPVSGIINEDTKTNWVTVGLVFGVKIQDKLPSIFDIDLPNILDIF